MAYIYVIRNNQNSKVYIGATTVSLERRLIVHKSNARTGLKGGKLIEAINLLGEENFIIELLEVCKETEMREREAYWQSEYNSIEEGYNILSEDYYLVYDLKGKYLSEEVRLEHISEKYNVDASSVTAILGGKQLRASGITVFRKNSFSEESLQERLNKLNNSNQSHRDREFNVYRDGELVGTFLSKTECAYTLGLTRQKIGQCLLGRIKQHKG